MSAAAHACCSDAQLRSWPLAGSAPLVARGARDRTAGRWQRALHARRSTARWPRRGLMSITRAAAATPGRGARGRERCAPLFVSGAALAQEFQHHAQRHLESHRTACANWAPRSMPSRIAATGWRSHPVRWLPKACSLHRAGHAFAPARRPMRGAASTPPTARCWNAARHRRASSISSPPNSRARAAAGAAAAGWRRPVAPSACPGPGASRAMAAQLGALSLATGVAVLRALQCAGHRGCAAQVAQRPGPPPRQARRHPDRDALRSGRPGAGRGRAGIECGAGQARARTDRATRQRRHRSRGAFAGTCTASTRGAGGRAAGPRRWPRLRNSRSSGLAPFPRRVSCRRCAAPTAPCRSRAATWPGSGIARGIDDDGALKVEHAGRIHRIIAGEVSVRGARRPPIHCCSMRAIPASSGRWCATDTWARSRPARSGISRASPAGCGARRRWSAWSA